MCSPQAAMAGVMGFGAITQAQGAKAQASSAKDAAYQQQASLLYQEKVDKNNAQIAEWQRQDSIRQGNRQEQDMRMQAAQFRSRQKTGIAANGIALDSDTALDILTSTDYLTERDAMTIQDNALRQAWGYEVQKTNFSDNAQVRQYEAARVGANAASISPGRAFTTSLLGSATAAAPSLYGMYKGGAFSGGGAGESIGSAGSGVTLNGLKWK